MNRSICTLVVALVSMAACGGSNHPAAESIGPAGGTVTASTNATVTIPANALTASVAITADAAPSAATPANVTRVGDAITLGPEGQTFSTAVTVTMPITMSLLPSGKTAASVVIYTAPAGSSAYTALTTSVVDATHVSATVLHFSTFVPGVAGGCAVNSDCASGMCVSGVCLGNCLTNSDCPPGHICVSGGTCQ